MVINNANKTSENLNLNFINLIFESESEKENKIDLIKEFSKVESANILFFYAIKYMISNKFENIKYMNETHNENNEYNEYNFIINYIQFFIEIFFEKEYLLLEEFDLDKEVEDLIEIDLKLNDFDSEDEKECFYDHLREIMELKEYIKYLKSLITKDDTVLVKFNIDGIYI